MHGPDSGQGCVDLVLALGERLSHIGGYLMTYGDSGRITLSSQLPATDRIRALSQLLERLTQTPVGTSGVLLWHPTDE